MRMIGRGFALAGMAAVLAGCAMVPAATGGANAALLAAPDCAPAEGLRFICGTGAVEELAAIPGSDWLIAGNLDVGAGARLRLIDTSQMTVADLPVDLASPAPVSPDCPGPPDPARWSISGLAVDAVALGAPLLYLVNHGSQRMGIEVFDLDLSGSLPLARWRGCAVMPEGTLPNALAPDGFGGAYVISFHAPRDGGARERMARRAPTGSVWHWYPHEGLRRVETGPLSGGNGIALSPDGETLWLAEWAAGRLVALDLARGTRREIALGYLPDNLHFTADGQLLIAGQAAAVADILACGARCPQPWLVARLDPADGGQTLLLHGDGSERIDYAAGAVPVDDAVWVTLRSGDGRVGRF